MKWRDTTKELPKHKEGVVFISKGNEVLQGYRDNETKRWHVIYARVADCNPTDEWIKRWIPVHEFHEGLRI